MSALGLGACAPFGAIYRRLLRDLLGEDAATERNHRTWRMIRAYPHPTSFILDLRDGQLPVPGVRRMFPQTAAAEVAWFLQGTQDIAWLQNHTKIWDQFAEHDEEGHFVVSSYGWRWRREFGRDQVQLALDTLARDPSSRQVLVSAWDPARDGLGTKQLATPCPTHFTLSIVEGVLNMALFLRSSDVFVGLPYDIMGHALLQKALAHSLSIQQGYLHVTLAHPHIYEAHWGMAAEALKTSSIYDTSSLAMPEEWSVDGIVGSPDGYVNEVAARAGATHWPAYSPRPGVVA